MRSPPSSNASFKNAAKQGRHKRGENEPTLGSDTVCTFCRWLVAPMFTNWKGLSLCRTSLLYIVLLTRVVYVSLLEAASSTAPETGAGGTARSGGHDAAGLR